MKAPRGSRLAFGAAFLALLVVGYAHTLSYPYHFDDFYSVRDNPALRAPGDLAAIWQFRPSRFVTHLSLAWNLAVADSPLSLHLVNVLIHAAASLLVGLVAAAVSSQLRGGRSWDAADRRIGAGAALLFVAHPLATQAVTYIVQRGTALAALLELAAVAAFLRARAVGRTRWWVVSWCFALLAGLTKEMAVALPALVLLTEAVLRQAGSPGRATWKTLAPYLLVFPLVGITASLPATALREAPIGFVETHEVSRATYLLTQLTVIPRYLGLLVWPRGQSLEHDVAWVDAPGAAALGGLALMVALVAAAIAMRRRLPLATLGLGWCLIALVPESSVIPIRDAMVEHRMYLPMAGLIWAAAAALESLATRWRERPAARRVSPVPVTLLVAAALAVTTHVRNRVWRDELSLWTDASARAPHKARPHNNRGMAFEELGRVADAEAAFREAIAAEPLNVPARINLSRIYGTHGRFAEAVRVLDEAERIEPANPTVLHNLGSAWLALGDTTRAAAYYERATRAGPPP
ncbi:MAG TPA: tetratricopeptide repeat protein [Candidatus Eisenbacteria bacterium]|nr:tetratricopeptide repeat protein [Candidatus Eisenbacteria bacterium]